MLDFLRSATRLYDLAWHGEAGPALAVEAWWGVDQLGSGFEYVLDLLGTEAGLPLTAFLGRALTLHTRLSDGTAFARSGLVRAARDLGSDGGLARYRLTVVPWIWTLSRGRHNRVFQDKSVVQIVEAVFADYADIAAWQWADDVAPFLAAISPRAYCVQYGESDFAFVRRLLAEEGLGTRFEAAPEAPAGHRLVVFADSRSLPEDVLSRSATGGLGLRFHRADAQEAQDSIVAFGRRHGLGPTRLTLLSSDYRTGRSVAAQLPGEPAGPHAPVIHAFDAPGPEAFAGSRDAERAARLTLEAHEARQHTVFGRSTVRSLAAGTAIDVVGLPTAEASAPLAQRYVVTAVTHAGINNLPGEAIAGVARRLAEPLPDTAELASDDALRPVRAPAAPPAELLALAAERGYANTFDALPAATPWRPWLADGSGARRNPRPTAPGPMSAIVVGPHGETTPHGADELWCDALGRIKLRFHWQEADAPDDRDSCWLRVMSRQAGAGMGWQWLPRIGQEVLVDFINGDIDRPFVLGALWNGRGEGGVPATPGGAASHSDTTVFDGATDQRAAGQGNLTGGNAPAWHGGAEAAHRHAAALSGFKSKEFGGSGANQLVFDDSDGELRTSLASSQHASALSLGHLIHQADNYRGSPRGEGIELRTDAWGALRGGRGVLLTTWAQAPHEPAGDAAPLLALLKQADSLVQTLARAATAHQTAAPSPAPVQALHAIASGMVDGANPDATAQGPGPSHIPALAEPALMQAGRAGIAELAGRDIHYAAGDTLAFASGEDTHLAIAGRTRIHAGTAIGITAGAIRPGPDNVGIRLVAARGNLDLQAHQDEIKLQSTGALKLVSANAHADFAAAKRIRLAVAGGASLTIDGDITVQCPGTITVQAGKKSFSGPATQSYALPQFPQTVCRECLLAAMKSGSPFAAPAAA